MGGGCSVGVTFGRQLFGRRHFSFCRNLEMQPSLSIIVTSPFTTSINEYSSRRDRSRLSPYVASSFSAGARRNRALLQCPKWSYDRFWPDLSRFTKTGDSTRSRQLYSTHWLAFQRTNSHTMRIRPLPRNSSSVCWTVILEAVRYSDQGGGYGMGIPTVSSDGERCSR